jgi:hypothetical protein
VLLHRAADLLDRSAILEIGITHGMTRRFLDLSLRFLDSSFDLILVHDISFGFQGGESMTMRAGGATSRA